MPTSPRHRLVRSVAAIAFLIPVLLANGEVLRRGLTVGPTVAALGVSFAILGLAGWAFVRRGYTFVGVVYALAALPAGGVALFFLFVWWWLRDLNVWSGGH